MMSFLFKTFKVNDVISQTRINQTLARKGLENEPAFKGMVAMSKTFRSDEEFHLLLVIKSLKLVSTLDSKSLKICIGGWKAGK